MWKHPAVHGLDVMDTTVVVTLQKDTTAIGPLDQGQPFPIRQQASEPVGKICRIKIQSQCQALNLV